LALEFARARVITPNNCLSSIDETDSSPLAFLFCILGTHGEPHGPQIEASIEKAQGKKNEESQSQEICKEGQKEAGQESETACQTRQKTHPETHQGQSPPQVALRETDGPAGIFQQPVFVNDRPNEFTPRRFELRGVNCF
jgi:hypothetical protein